MKRARVFKRTWCKTHPSIENPFVPANRGDQPVHRRNLSLLALVLLIPALSLAAQDIEEEFTWSGTVAKGDAIEIQNLNGAIAAEYASGSQVEVVAIKEGKASDVAEVSIEVVEHTGGVTICAIYPTRNGRENVCAAGDDSELHSNDKNKARVTFEVRVPAGVEFVGSTMNGRVTADDMQSNLRLTTMNGAISADSTGWVHATTMNGAVDVEMGSADWSGELELASMNGAITVTLPASASVSVDAETMNGRVSSDWDDVQAHGRRKNHASGTIGNGGRELELSTMNGSIRLRRAH